MKAKTRPTDISIFTDKIIKSIDDNYSKINYDAKKLSTVTKYDIYDFAQDRKIDELDALDCFNMNKQRNFKDRNGQPIKSLFGAIYKFCKQRKIKRSNPNGKTR